MVVPVAPAVGGLGGDVLDPAKPTAAPTAGIPSADRVEPGLLDRAVASDGPVPVIVQFEDGVPAAPAAASLPGLTVRYTFEAIPAVYGVAAPSTVETLADHPDVRYVEYAHKPVGFLLDTATLSTLAREVWDPAADNPVVDGTWVGVALVDTGIDTTHPDFLGTGKVAANYLVTPAGLVDGPYHSPQTPHGTAVAGVVAGTGQAGGGTFAGAAPGATLYSFNVQPARSVWNPTNDYTVWPAIALDWILAHGHEQDPPIRVVQNAWHCQYPSCQTFNPDQVHHRIVSDLAEAGYVVTFAAGNFNPKAESPGIAPEATNPTPGVLGVTGYDDEDLAIRTGCAETWGIGDAADPASWPDLTAPASRITTTWGVHADDDTRVPEVRRTYSLAGGTSLSSGHVSGIAALLLQADPQLSPAEVEYLLKATAEELPENTCGVPYVRADTSHPWDGANHRAGHGLVDAYAAVENATSFDGIPEDAPPLEEPTDALYPDRPGVQVQERFYLAGDDDLTTERPTDDGEEIRPAAPNEELVFTSAPLTGARTVEGIDASVWVSAPLDAARPIYGYLVDVRLALTVQRLDAAGDVVASAQAGDDLIFAPAGLVPMEVSVVDLLDAPLTLEAGDRLRVIVSVTDAGLAGEETAATPWQLHWGSADRPTHVGVGTRIDRVGPGSYEECRLMDHEFCAWLDADHPTPQWTCETHGTYRLSWFGPPGSTARLTCYGSVATCTVPGAAGDPWDTCVAYAHWTGGIGGEGHHVCAFDVPEGTPPDYHGKCEVAYDP